MKKFKSILMILVVAIIVAPLLNSCKKGAEDPFISFKSRDGRLQGTWKLTSMEGTEKQNYFNNFGSSKVQYTTDNTYTYDGNKLKRTSTETEITTTGTTSTTEKEVTVTDQAVELKITFEDNKITVVMTYGSGTETYTYTDATGTFTTNTTITGTRTEEETGNWYWGNSKKNKTMLFSSTMIEGELLKLGGKEMIITTDESNKMTQNVTRTTNYSSGSVTTTNSDPSSYSSNFKWTFTKE